jgi:dihydropyrimidine dehydrogenase (NAD+) subunit PreA
MINLEVNFAGVKFRNPLILASATPGWDGEGSNRAWRAGAVPKVLLHLEDGVSTLEQVG